MSRSATPLSLQVSIPDARTNSPRSGADGDVEKHEFVHPTGRVVLWVDDVDAMYRRALAAGFDPATSPTNAPWGERYFHIHDPDGHELSFARPLAPR